MSKRKSFALRISPEILQAMQTWADDEIRSLNAQIEYVLRNSLVKAGRVKLTRPAEVEMTEPAEDDDS